MNLNFKEIEESIRIKNKSISLDIIVASGMENNTHVMISPAVLVSGYGNTKEEANESFELNLAPWSVAHRTPSFHAIFTIGRHHYNVS